ncbi:MAG: NlpC/P60 family protein [Hespellia sp.]|nr:NlpC/P60 family protein [Hespellia sp.]
MKATCIRQRLIISALAGAFMIPGSAGVVYAAEESAELPSAGIEAVLDSCYQSGTQHDIEYYLGTEDQGEYSDMAFANVSDFAYIRSAPSESSEWIGKLYAGTSAKVLDTMGTWSQITSGPVTGYVQSDQLYTGGAAREYADLNNSQMATVTAYVLNVRDGQSTDYNILTQIMMDEQYPITGEAVEGWYPVQVGEIAGWVSGEYITIDSTYTYAESKDEEAQRLAQEEAEAAEAKAQEEEEAAAAEAAAQVSSSGQAVIDFACQFIGNPYVWGGTSLTDGADCSGFIQSVYANFGVELPRTSGEMRSAGYEVSYEEAQPGDIICYEGHVGLYMGDGTIVNAIDSDHGIGISNATFTNIITIRRMF